MRRLLSEVPHGQGARNKGDLRRRGPKTAEGTGLSLHRQRTAICVAAACS